MDIEYVRERITQLRLQKGVSEYQMSYDLGHSRGYINNISSGKTLPSMTEFFAICDYFGITPIEFFNAEVSDPKLSNEILDAVNQLAEDDLSLVRSVINPACFGNKNSPPSFWMVGCRILLISSARYKRSCTSGFCGGVCGECRIPQSAQ